MIDISNELYDIANKPRGEEVRDAFTDACEKVTFELLPDAETEGHFLTVNSSGKWEAMPWI